HPLRHCKPPDGVVHKATAVRLHVAQNAENLRGLQVLDVRVLEDGQIGREGTLPQPDQLFALAKKLVGAEFVANLLDTWGGNSTRLLSYWWEAHSPAEQSNDEQ